MASQSSACLVLAFARLTAAAVVYVPNFTAYPGYDGNLSVAGAIAIDEVCELGVQRLRWSLLGLDAACTEDAGDNATDGCGIRVHEGTSCDSDADVGGHYQESSGSDPWPLVVYMASADGSSREQPGVRLATGMCNREILGRVVVVHASDGARVACGVIGTETGDGYPVYVSSFAPYPGYSGNAKVEGFLSMVGTSGNDTTATQTLNWILHGLDAACVSSAGDNVTNGCGIHVHTGTSCDSHEAVGGHYYSSALGSDPWLPVVYVAAANGSAGWPDQTVGVPVVTGLSNADITGHVVVVHGLENGERIACGVVHSGKWLVDLGHAVGKFLGSLDSARSVGVALPFLAAFVGACSWSFP